MRLALAFALAVGLALALASSPAGAGGVRPDGLGDVRAVRLEANAERTRVVIELSRKAEYQVRELGSPRRLYIDLDGVWIDAPQAAPQTGAPGSALRVVRGGQNTLQRARVVLELDASAPRPKVFTLESPYRIVADLAVPAPEPPPVASGDPPDWDRRIVRRIVLDAGHGGKDPGALGPKQAREASVVLAITRALRDELTRRGFEVIMTRASDVFLTLEARTDLANHHDADLFLSVHANAARNRKLAGVETYLLDTRYDRQTARVAARENGTTVAKLSELHMILAALRLGNNERYASRYAELVQRSLVAQLRKTWPETVDLGVKRGPFLVLFQADMPAILVEVGFVSNPEESRRLRSRAFTRAAALGIADGVSTYRDQQAEKIVARR